VRIITHRSEYWPDFIKSSIYNFLSADVEGTVPMSFFTSGTDLKLSNKRLPYNRLKLFREIESHNFCPSVMPASSLWNGSSRSHLEDLDSRFPDDSASDADLMRASDGSPNFDESDDLVSGSVEDVMSAANTPPRFSSPSVNDVLTKTKGSAAFDLF
jgi:hypothetical protein